MKPSLLTPALLPLYKLPLPLRLVDVVKAVVALHPVCRVPGRNKLAQC